MRGGDGAALLIDSPITLTLTPTIRQTCAQIPRHEMDARSIHGGARR